MSPFRADAHGVLGAGRLGASLALALSRAGYPVLAVAARSAERAESLARRLPGARALSTEALVEASSLVWLAVPDDAVAALAQSLPWRSGQAVVHCSGALELSVLDPAARAGAQRGCFHPLQSFPEASGAVERFSGIACGVEADGPLADFLSSVCSALGARSVSLAGVERARYHAAAVLVSNHVVALHAAAARVWVRAGLPAELARGALAPLTRTVAENIAQRPLQDTLTGPLARGDLETVARHLRALADAPELARLYRGLCRELLALPLALPEARRRELLALIDGEPVV